MNPNNLVCRTCLGIISEGKVAHNIDEENGLIKNVRNIREMIMFCVPEMDIYISISPVICEPCITILISVYNFKIRCLRVENAIRSYVTTNNVMEGSCVNLNNVVRQQIVEALKQKNWPLEQINEYLDKHLCTSKTPTDRPISSLFRVMAQKLNAPQLLNNANLRAAGMNVFEPPPAVDTNSVHAPAGGTGLLPPYPGTNQVAFRPPQPLPPPPGGRFISVSRNLMPPPAEGPSLNQGFRVVSAANAPSFSSVDFRPPVPPGSLSTTAQPQNKAYPIMGDFQSTFLTALQLTSTAEGGREEAVLVKKTTKPKRVPKSSKKLVPSQPTGNTPTNKGSYLNPVPVTLCPITGRLFQKGTNKGIGKETGLRIVRKSLGSQVGNNKDAGGSKSDDIIILDDNPVVVTQKVGDELLLMNFDDNEHVRITDNMQGTPKDVNENTASTPTKPMVKEISVRLPMIDPDTLRQKLTTEDVIDEIESKRRKLVVKLNSSLPYLHTKKRLTVKVARDRFFSCVFCKFTGFKEEELRAHYLSKHKVCSRCTFKSNRTTVLTQHINAMHPLDLKEALKKVEESREFHCYLCNFTGLSDLDLKDHRLRIHIKCDAYGLYKCPYLTCDTRNAIAYDINRHIERVHDKLRRVQCPLCNYVAVQVSHLKKHIESHSLMKIKCHLCDLGFKTTFSLKLHVKKKHLNTEYESTSGMVFGTDSNRADDDTDYRVTLDTLQSRAIELRETTESLPDTTTTRNDHRNLDEYEFALPSLGEMLCAQTFTEEASDQEEDCTIVSEAEPPESHKRKRSRPTSGTKVYFVRKKRRYRKPEESCVPDDPDDCMIVTEDIPIVDLSDDDEDQNDNEDCVVVSDVVGVAGSATQKSADSETDTCSELSVGVRQTTPVSAVSGSETDTCSEVSAGDVLSQKTRSVENLGREEAASENIMGSENAMPESGNESQCVNVQLDSSSEKRDATKEKTVILQSGSSAAQSASEKELLNIETPLSTVANEDVEIPEAALSASEKEVPNIETPLSTMSVANEDVEIPEAAQSASEKELPNIETPLSTISVANEDVEVLEAAEPTTDSLESSDHQSERSKCTSLMLYNPDKGPDLRLEEDGARIPDKTQSNTSSPDIELENTKKLEENSTISEPKSPQECQKPSESVVIESSDEDSNDCTFVAATEARENLEEENKDANKSDKEEDSGRVEKGNSENEVDVKDKDDVLVAIDEVSEIEAQENVEKENKDIDKSDDEEDSEMVEKETPNEKDVSDTSKECREDLNKKVDVKDKGDVFVTNDEVSETIAQGNVEEEYKSTDKTDNEEMIEKETINKSALSDVSKSIEDADLKECQEFDKELDKGDDFVTSTEVSYKMSLKTNEMYSKSSNDTVSTEPVAVPDDYTLFSDSESDNFDHTQTELEVTQVKTNNCVGLTEEKINELIKSDSEMEYESDKGETSQSTNKNEPDILISDSQVESEQPESSRNASGAEKSMSDVLENIESSGTAGKSVESTKTLGIDSEIRNKPVTGLETIEKNTNAESIEGPEEDRLSKNEVYSERNLRHNEASENNATKVDLESTEKTKNVLSVSGVTNIVQDSCTTEQHADDGRDVTDDSVVSISNSTVSEITENVNIASVQNLTSSGKEDSANIGEISEHCSEEVLSSDSIQSCANS